MNGPVDDKNQLKLLLLPTDAMRARRRPQAILWMWAFKLALSLAVAWPAARAVGVAVGSHPSGDAAFFAEGGYALLEWLSREASTRGALAALLGAVTVVGIALGVVPLVAAIAAMAYTTPEGRAPTARQLASRVVAAVWPVFGLLGLATLTEALLVGLAFAVATGTRGGLVQWLGEARGEQSLIVLLMPIAALAALVGVLQDLARVSVVRFEAGAFDAIKIAWRAYRARPVAALWAWLWRSLVGLLLIGLGAVASARLGGRPGGALVTLAALHQLVSLSCVALRASWLARALRAVDASETNARRSAPPAP